MQKLRRFMGGSDLDGLLRSHRSEAREEFVADLSKRVLNRPYAPRRAWSRVAYAAAASTFILGVFASFGGLGHAASGAAGTYDAVKQVAAKHSLIVSVDKSSASAQYAPKPKPHKKPPKNVAAGVAGRQAAAGVAGVRTGGTLPFTGVSLATTLVLSIALIVAGLALRRRERRS